MSAAEKAMKELLGDLRLSLDDADSQVDFMHDDPIVASKFRPAAASAAAIAAQAVGIATIWRMRSGRGQRLMVDLRRAAVPGLRTSQHIWQNGHYLALNRPPREARNFFPTKDGRRIYLLRASAYAPHLIALLDLLGCRNDSDAIAAAVQEWDSGALEAALDEHGLIGAVARTRQEWLSHPQGAWLARQPPVQIEKIGAGPPQPFGQSSRPLSGVRVLDMAHLLAGPTCARVLAEQGADVLRVSPPLRQDDFRYVIDTSFGKRLAFIDLDRPGDLERLKELLSGADIFVQSFRPGSLAKRGLSPEDLAAASRGIVYVSVSTYGEGGPWRHRGGLEQVGQAVSGLAVAEGSLDQPMLAPTFTLNDYLAAYLAAAGAAAALIRRATEGGSYHIQVSLTRCSMWLQEIGMLPPERWPAQTGDAQALPDAPPGSLVETRCAFGLLKHPKPLVEFSETVPSWTVGPSPLGAAELRWSL